MSSSSPCLLIRLTTCAAPATANPRQSLSVYGCVLSRYGNALKFSVRIGCAILMSRARWRLSTQGRPDSACWSILADRLSLPPADREGSALQPRNSSRIRSRQSKCGNRGGTNGVLGYTVYTRLADEGMLVNVGFAEALEL